MNDSARLPLRRTKGRSAVSLCAVRPLYRLGGRNPMKLNDTLLSLPPQQVSIDVLLEKYAKGDEQTVDDVRRRVARALAAVENDPATWEPMFYEALESGFIPGGRVNSAAGTQLRRR